MSEETQGQERPEVTTLDEIEAIVHACPEWQGTDGPEFSADGGEWTPYWLGKAPPALARVMVHRQGRAPVSTVVSWQESLPEDEEVQARWLRQPSYMLGARALRTGYLRTFRDRMRVVSEEPGQAPAAAPARDWAAELRSADGVEELRRMWYEAGQARARTGPLEVLYRERLEELTPAPIPSPASMPRRAPRGGRPAWKAKPE